MIGSKSFDDTIILNKSSSFPMILLVYDSWQVRVEKEKKNQKIYHDNNIGLIFLMGIVNLLPYL